METRSYRFIVKSTITCTLTEWRGSIKIKNKSDNSIFFTHIGIASTARSYKKTLLMNYLINWTLNANMSVANILRTSLRAIKPFMKIYLSLFPYLDFSTCFAIYYTPYLLSRQVFQSCRQGLFSFQFFMYFVRQVANRSVLLQGYVEI